MSAPTSELSPNSVPSEELIIASQRFTRYLPDEILLMILKYLSYSDRGGVAAISAFSRACYRFRGLANPILYRNIMLRDREERSSYLVPSYIDMMWTKQDRLARSFLHNRNLCHHVRSLKLGTFCRSVETDLEPLYDLLQCVDYHVKDIELSIHLDYCKDIAGLMGCATGAMSAVDRLSLRQLVSGVVEFKAERGMNAAMSPQLEIEYIDYDLFRLWTTYNGVLFRQLLSRLQLIRFHNNPGGVKFFKHLISRPAALKSLDFDTSILWPDDEPDTEPLESNQTKARSVIERLRESLEFLKIMEWRTVSKVNAPTPDLSLFPRLRQVRVGMALFSRGASSMAWIRWLPPTLEVLELDSRYNKELSFIRFEGGYGDWLLDCLRHRDAESRRDGRINFSDLRIDIVHHAPFWFTSCWRDPKFIPANTTRTDAHGHISMNQQDEVPTTRLGASSELWSILPGDEWPWTGLRLTAPKLETFDVLLHWPEPRRSSRDRLCSIETDDLYCGGCGLRAGKSWARPAWYGPFRTGVNRQA